MSDALLPTTTTTINSPVVYTQTAPNSKQFFGEVGAVNTNITQIISTTGEVTNINLSTEYCNIFVVKDECFSGIIGNFNIPKCKVMRRNTDSEICLRFGRLGTDFIEEIKTFPSLFMDINHDYRRCANPAQIFFYGIVTSIIEQKKFYRIGYQKLSYQPLLQQQLNDNAILIGLNTDNGQDTLDETGWKIKKIDIRKALINVGIYL